MNNIIILVLQILLLIILSLSPINSQITHASYRLNTESELTIGVEYNSSSSIPNISRMTTDRSNSIYSVENGTLSCIFDSLESRICNIKLNNDSQTEKYTIYYTLGGGSQQSFITSNKVKLTQYFIGFDQPTPTKPLLTFNGYYYQPYLPNSLTINITINGITKTYEGSGIKFIDSTHFQISLPESSVGYFNYSIYYDTGLVNNGETSFKNPIINSITSIQSIENSYQISINGNNFGGESFKNYSLITINDSIIVPQSDYITYNDNIIILKNNNNRFTETLNFKISLANVSSTPYQLNLRPVIESISPNTLDYSGGNITITGQYLNCIDKDGTDSDIKIMFGDSLTCDNPYNPIVNDSTIVICKLGEGDQSSFDLKILITIHSLSNIDDFKFTYAIPIIESFIQSGDDEITLFTKLFGLIANLVKFNGVEIPSTTTTTTSSTSSSSSSVKFKLLSNSLNGMVQVIVDSNRISPEFYIRIKPIISNVQGTIATNGGNITISGKYLGVRSYNSSIPLPILISNGINNNKNVCNEIYQNNNNEIICDHIEGTGMNNNIMVRIDSIESNNNFKFSYLPPSTISSTFKLIVPSDNNKPIYGSIQGSNFGNSLSKSSVSVNSSSVSVISVTHNEIMFNIPPQSPQSSLLRISIDSQSTSNDIEILPIIRSSSKVLTEGGEITITGGFFHYESSIDVVIGKDIQCYNARVSERKDSIICYLMDGTGANLNINVTIDGKPVKLSDSNNPRFSFLPPTISRVIPGEYIYANQEAVVTIIGKSMGLPSNISVGLGIPGIIPFYCDRVEVINFEMTLCHVYHPFLDDVTGLQLILTVNGQKVSGIYRDDQSSSTKPEEKDVNNIKTIIVGVVCGLLGFSIIGIVTFVVVKKKRKDREIEKVLKSTA